MVSLLPKRGEPAARRGRNDVGECCPQFARKNQGEIHSVEWYQGRTAHLAACSSNRNLPSLTHPMSTMRQSRFCSGTMAEILLLMPRNPLAEPPAHHWLSRSSREHHCARH